jgi:hypothetical protein
MKLLLTSDSANSADGSRAPYFRGKRAGNWNETLFNACYDREGTVRPGWYEANDGLKNKNGDFSTYRDIYGLSYWKFRRLRRKA